MDSIERRSIDMLYAEAVVDAENRAATHEALLRPPPSALGDDGYSESVVLGPSNESPIHPLNASDTEFEFPPVLTRDPSAKGRLSHSEDSFIVLASAMEGEGEPKRVSEVFEQTDIREAIEILASIAEVSVVIDDSIGGSTSAVIEDETFEQALEKILLPVGLVFAIRNGKYIIAPPDPDSPLFDLISQRSQYLPAHHQAVLLASYLPPRFKVYVNSLPERNLIVVDAPELIAKDILSRLRELDQPVAQIELEAIVCVVAPDSGFRFGLDWGHVVGVEGVNSLKAGLTGLTFSGSVSPHGVSNAFSDFAVTSAFVKLLAQEGYVTIRAAPRVTAKDGEKAEISINRETFFSLQPTDSNVFFRQDVQKVEAGISLEITPRVYGNMVAVDISKAEVSEDIRSSDVRSELTANPYPIINRRTVSTNVNVRDGHTVVIGGLVQKQTVDRINRIPGLSRIPLAGKLFQTVEKQEQDAEVAIFITPRIVPCNSCVVPN